MTNNLTTKTAHTTRRTTTYPIRVRPTSYFPKPLYAYDDLEVVSCSYASSSTANITYNTIKAGFSSQNSVINTISQSSLTPSYAPTTASDLYYYGYRYYSTTLGRWINNGNGIPHDKAFDIVLERISK